MLYYEDTKLKRRRKVTRTDVNKYIGAAAKALAVGEPIIGRQNLVEFGRWRALALLHLI